MKRFLHFALGLAVTGAALSLQSCDKLKDKVASNAVPEQTVTFSGASTDIVIPPCSDTTAQGTVGQASLDYNIDSMINAESQGILSYNDIESIKISKIKLTLNDATTASNFANFEYAGAAFNTDANGGNYPAYTLGYVEHNPDSYASEVSPPVTDASQDVKKYFNKKMEFYYIVVAKLRRATKTPLHCHIEVSYDIQLKKQS